jgi:hypothetical protein
LKWHGGTPTTITDAAHGFRGQFVTGDVGSATLQWMAKEPGFEFRSDVGVSKFARIGHERNGSFF